MIEARELDTHADRDGNAGDNDERQTGRGIWCVSDRLLVLEPGAHAGLRDGFCNR